MVDRNKMNSKYSLNISLHNLTEFFFRYRLDDNDDDKETRRRKIIAIIIMITAIKQ